MQAVLYYVFVAPLIYLFSVMPFRLLYVFSGFFFFLIYHVFGYRKKVVLENLRNSFPEKSEAEINKIAKDYYHFLCDVFLEILKAIRIPAEELKKRSVFTEESKKLIGSLYERKQNFIGIMGHCGNWEWSCLSFKLNFQHQLSGLYHPVSNKQFDKLMFDLRSRFGSHIIAMNNLPREIPKIRNMITSIGLIADQTPPPEGAYWTTFLNQDTPVFFGSEKLAKKLNYPVVFFSVKKIRRGYYQIHAELVTDKPKDEPEGAISERHTRLLERNIIEQPETWLWSHRRWKHKREKVRSRKLSVEGESQKSETGT
jgi:Kdo2-lipid IVA lauroyltransferase/acyltransferase